jgi:hypothetical protein
MTAAPDDLRFAFVGTLFRLRIAYVFQRDRALGRPAGAEVQRTLVVPSDRRVFEYSGPSSVRCNVRYSVVQSLVVGRTQHRIDAPHTRPDMPELCMHSSPSEHRLTFRRSLTAPGLAITLAVTSFNFVRGELRNALDSRDEMQRAGGLLIRHPGVRLSWHTCSAQGNGRIPRVDDAGRFRAGRQAMR